jgi:hypothetical protein
MRQTYQMPNTGIVNTGAVKRSQINQIDPLHSLQNITGIEGFRDFIV